MADGQLVDKNILKTLVPPNALNAENFQELSGKAFVEDIGPGKVVFKTGDTDRKTTYLLGPMSSTNALPESSWKFSALSALGGTSVLRMFLSTS